MMARDSDSKSIFLAADVKVDEKMLASCELDFFEVVGSDCGAERLFAVRATSFGPIALQNSIGPMHATGN